MKRTIRQQEMLFFPADTRYPGEGQQQGRLYTTEETAGRVQQFSAAGMPLAAWGDKGTQAGGFRDLKIDTAFSSSRSNRSRARGKSTEISSLSV